MNGSATEQSIFLFRSDTPVTMKNRINFQIETIMFKHMFNIKVNKKSKLKSRNSKIADNQIRVNIRYIFNVISIGFVLTYAYIQREENNQIQKQQNSR